MSFRMWKQMRGPAILLLVAACSGGGDVSGTDGGPGDWNPDDPIPELATAAEFCDTLYGTFARRYAECSKAAPAWAEHFIDKTKLCINVVKASQSGAANYDKTRAGRCAAAFAGASCTSLQAVLDESELPSDCLGALQGTRPSLESCHADEECASGRCSATSGDTCPGICYAGLAVGQSCFESRDCQPGLHCYLGTLWTTRTCQPLANHPGEGQECFKTVGCSAGFYCRTTSSSTFKGTCAQYATSGACTSSDRTAPGYACVGGKVEALLGPGAACSSGAARCGPGLYCAPDSTCQQVPGVGESCVEADAKYAGCIGGTCDSVNGICVARNPSVCFSDWDCAPDAVCNGQFCESACRLE